MGMLNHPFSSISLALSWSLRGDSFPSLLEQQWQNGLVIPGSFAVNGVAFCFKKRANTLVVGFIPIH